MQQLTQDNARLQREVEALGDVRRQERTLQGNVQQLTQDNARLQREVEALGDVRRQERTLQGNVQQLTQDNARLQREEGALQVAQLCNRSCSNKTHTSWSQEHYISYIVF